MVHFVRFRISQGVIEPFHENPREVPVVRQLLRQLLLEMKSLRGRSAARRGVSEKEFA